jgi:hypothetical protein
MSASPGDFEGLHSVRGNVRIRQQIPFNNGFIIKGIGLLVSIVIIHHITIPVVKAVLTIIIRSLDC